MTVTLPGAPTPGNLLVCWVTAFQDRASFNAAWTDSGVTVTDANQGVCRLIYRYVQGGDTAVRPIGTCNTNFWCASIVELDGVTGTWATDLEATRTGSSTSSSFATTAYATTQAGDLAYCGVQCAGVSTLSGGFSSPWVERVTQNAGYTCGAASQLMGSIGANVQCTLTWTHSFTATYIVAVFRQAAGTDGEVRSTFIEQSAFGTTEPPVRSTFIEQSMFGAVEPPTRTTFLILSAFMGPPVPKNRRTTHVIHGLDEDTISGPLSDFIGDTPYD